MVQVSEPPAAPKGMSVPPPPPPEPPKMETKGETSAKAAKTAPKEDPAVKQAEPKGKSAKDAFGKLFRAKVHRAPRCVLDSIVEWIWAPSGCQTSWDGSFAAGGWSVALALPVTNKSWFVFRPQHFLVSALTTRRRCRWSSFLWVFGRSSGLCPCGCTQTYLSPPVFMLS